MTRMMNGKIDGASLRVQSTTKFVESVDSVANLAQMLNRRIATPVDCEAFHESVATAVLWPMVIVAVMAKFRVLDTEEHGAPIV